MFISYTNLYYYNQKILQAIEDKDETERVNALKDFLYRMILEYKFQVE